MKKALAMIGLLTAVMMMFSLFGCDISKQFDIRTYKNAKEKTMLVDYFKRTVGTPEEQPYYEVVLYTYSDTQALLEEYTKGGSEDETVTSYLIPIEAAQDMLTAVKRSGMAGWSRRLDTAGITGKLYVCKFPDGKGGYIRASSEEMPPNGKNAFYQVETVMCSWLKDEYKTE